MSALPQINETSFRSRVLTRAGRPVVVLFTKPGCTACVSARFAVQKFANAYAGKVDIYTCDILMSPQLGITYGNKGVPLVMIFNEGLEVWRRVGGSVKPNMIAEQVDDLLSGEVA